MSLTGLALAGIVRLKAEALGFDRVAFGPAGPPDHAATFERWLDAGRAGTMAYLDETRAERLDPDRLLPGARSVIAVALSYAPPAGAAPTPGIARYAAGEDYHEVMRPRLEALRDLVSAAAGPGTRSRAAVDTSAVLERDLAARAGLGWIGKNTNLLEPTLGSWFFIGIVLTTAELPRDATVPDRCGSCTACLDACPTQAFVAPWELDARRCISYLTIEHRGDIDPALRAGLGGWLFGCDVCQEVCPWNRRARPGREPALREPVAIDAAQALALDTDGFRARFRGTAIRRARRAGLARNAALVLGNHGDAAAAPALRRALEDHEPSVRAAAAWALERLGAPAPSAR
ncbi:MAG: tRNA epoxyqueuosine(34) reductase QueG [Candidatus Rokubacteria bacterium]|nr:tRNA epoxyqueuosine(34) reductase QueG [Candidatus Rokubacteria bacterium]